ncbi:hypothetical protein [Mucilaginibacter glaciei]|uniref:Uncharacterized protein n=1 Tax=Mucilaginibacter glaciei TaxID=2772109 RepID=A0A926NTI7_9SPHI|nr:hypothetical protein [Mucilaginibacter glaciei]MBD1394742.1 hypothetical protein [Mucilaginibacter glaciei]
MESTLEGFDRANGQGKNHDIKGNVENAGNDMVKREDDNSDNKDLAKEILTVTPETESADGDESPADTTPPNDTPELENPTDQTASNKGQGPAGEDL